jgi:hypothetical protein
MTYRTEAEEEELVAIGSRIAEVAAKKVGEELEALPPEAFGSVSIILLSVYVFADLLQAGMTNLRKVDPDPVRAKRHCAQVVAFLSQSVEPPASSRYVN